MRDVKDTPQRPVLLKRRGEKPAELQVPRGRKTAEEGPIGSPVSVCPRPWASACSRHTVHTPGHITWLSHLMWWQKGKPGGGEPWGLHSSD